MLKKEVLLKDEVSTLKQMTAEMYKLMQSRAKVEPEEKRNETINEEVREKAEDRSENGMLKCDKCEYETIKRINLNKHMNIKHGQTG